MNKTYSTSWLLLFFFKSNEAASSFQIMNSRRFVKSKQLLEIKKINKQTKKKQNPNMYLQCENSEDVDLNKLSLRPLVVSVW